MTSKGVSESEEAVLQEDRAALIRIRERYCSTILMFLLQGTPSYYPHIELSVDCMSARIRSSLAFSLRVNCSLNYFS